MLLAKECNGLFSPVLFSLLKTIITYMSIIIPIILIITLGIRLFKYVLNSDDDVRKAVKLCIEKIFVAVAALFICIYGTRILFSDDMYNKLTSKNIFQTEYCYLSSKVTINPKGVTNNKITFKLDTDFEYDKLIVNSDTYKNTNKLETASNDKNTYTFIFYNDNKEITSYTYDCKYKTLCEKKESTIVSSSTGSYEVGDTPSNVNSTSDVTVDMVRKAIADFAIEVATNNKKDFIYSGYYKGSNGKATYASRNSQAYAGTRYSGITVYGTTGHQIYTGSKAGRNDWSGKRFVVECIGYQIFIVRYSTKLGNDKYTNFFNNSKWGFKSVNKNSLLPGDLLHFDGHYAIYVGEINGTKMISEIMNSSYPNTWTVRLAKLNTSKLVGVSRFTNIPSSINYNKVVSEPTLWAKADTVKPEITSLIYTDGVIKVTATDSTGSNFSDTNGNGINGYTITTNSTEPVKWTNIDYDNSVKTIKTTSFEIDNVTPGNYYVWVRDRGGNVNYKTITVK